MKQHEAVENWLAGNSAFLRQSIQKPESISLLSTVAYTTTKNFSLLMQNVVFSVITAILKKRVCVQLGFIDFKNSRIFRRFIKVKS